MSFNSRKLLFGSPYFTDPYWNNVSLLLHGDGIGSTPNGQQNNTFLDSSTNNLTITRSGTPTQGSLSPFALNGVAYSPTLHGGSSYFSSGNVDKLTLPSTAIGSALDYGTGNFTIECWYNFIQVGPNVSGFIISQTVSGNNNLLFVINSSRAINIWLGNVNLGTSVVNLIPLNTWCHVALVRNGTSVQVYVNGVSVLTRTSSASLGGGMLPCINGYGHASGYGNTCYISNMRIVKGLAVYTSNFTPPTSPLTLTSNGGATPSTAPTSGQVALLCDFTNGGIFDNTKKNVLTTVGDAKVSTSVVKYGTGSMYFDGTGDYLSNYTSQGAASTTFGTASFTVEMWVYFNAVSGNQGFCDASNQIGVSTTSGQFFFYKTATGLAFGNHNTGNLLTYNWTPIASVWYHVAVSRLGTSLKMFINGVEVASVINSTNFIGSGINIGVVATPYYLTGYIDDLRITKGVARYTSAFTPPTRAFPNVPVTDSYSDPYFDDTVLLLHGDGSNLAQNNTFLDSSSNNTITRSGTPTQGSFSPYALNGVAYSPTIHGGSGYFNGSADYLSLPYNSSFDFSSGAFTAEGWVYLNAVGAEMPIVSHLTTAFSGWSLFLWTNSRFCASFSGNDVDITGTSTIQTNKWYHVAVSGTTGSYKLFVNGVQEGATYTGATTLAGGEVNIGKHPLYQLYMNGYISNARIVNGRACYTSNFTPPTSPLTLTSNGGATPSTAPTSGQVALLCDFTNGGIFDNTKKNVLTTVGNAKVSTSVVKYGTGSMYFDGTGDYLTMPDSNNFALGTGNSTIEFWIYATALIQDSTIFAISTTANINDCYLQMSSGGALNYRESGVNISTANLLNTNTWTHVAIVRNGGTRTVYVNGTSAVTGAGTANITSNRCSVGAYSSGTLPIQGYIDDLRITKGVARYTSAFTPPTRAFPDK